MKKMKTSKAAVFVRAVVVVWLIFMPLSWMWNAATGTSVWSAFEMLLSAIITVAFFGTAAWAITKVAMGLIYGRNPEYRAYRRQGGDPFIDSLPRILKPRESAWQFQCPVCEAPVERRIDICGRCGYGSDGDSSAYFDRYGDVKPPEINDAEWEDIRSRHHA